MKEPPVWQGWRNPIVRRYATARLRPFRVLSWGLVLHALAAFLWLIVYFSFRKEVGVAHAALAAWSPILILQGLLWLVKGTFSVAVGIAKEGAEGLSESQRLTPLSAWHKVVGYLIGLPVLETALVASLLPWTALSVVIGRAPLGTVFRVHLLLVTSAVLHHCIGLVAGTVIRQKIVAGTVSQLLVIVLHFVAPLLSRFGLGPLGHLGIESAVVAELLPLHSRVPPASSVRFFNYDLTLTGYEWAVMSIMIAFLLQILHRRWKQAEAHLFSKPLAAAFSAWIIVMCLGEVFPLLHDGTLFDVGRRLANRRPRAGEGGLLDALNQGFIPLGWAGAFGCVALLSTMILSKIITPTLDEYGAARRAARDPAMPRLGWTADARSALGWTAGLGLMALAGWSILVKHMLDTPVLHLVMQPKPLMPLALGAGLLLPLAAWAVLLEWKGPKIAMMGVFLGWIVPLMVAGVGMASGISPTHWPKWCMAFSGLALPFYSMSQSMGGLADLSGLMQGLRTPWLLSLGTHAALAVGMLIGLKKAQRLSAQ